MRLYIIGLVAMFGVTTAIDVWFAYRIVERLRAFGEIWASDLFAFTFDVLMVGIFARRLYALRKR